MYLAISYVLALALLFSLPRNTYAMSQDALSSGDLLGALPQANSEQLNRVLGSLLNPQPSINQGIFTPIIEYSELDLSLLSEITVEMLRNYHLQYPNLKKLKVSGLIQSKRLIKVEQLKAIVRYFPYLEELDISYSDITGEDLLVLGNVNHLNLKRLDTITIKQLRELGVLKHLDFEEMSTMYDNLTMQGVRELGVLRFLCLEGFDDLTIKVLRGLGVLKHVKLETIPEYYDDLTVRQLQTLGLKHLKRLCLNSIRITDAGIDALVKAGIAAQLTHLEVNSTNLRDSGVIDMIINYFKRLTHLSIAGNYIYPSAISRLESHTYVYLDAKGNLGDPQETLKYLEAYNELRKKNKS
jgi:hypothetical protein